jgi:hypothetical protein
VTQTATGTAFGTFMRWLFVPLFSLSAGIADAIECGPVLRPERLLELANGVAQAAAQLLQHDSSLGREAEGLWRHASTQATLDRISKIQRDQDLLGYAHERTARLETDLQYAHVLAGIREVMVDKRDKVVVEKYLSSSAFFIKGSAERVLSYVNGIMAKLSRPSLAVDMARLRDSIAGVAEEFASCESSPSAAVR